MPSSATWPIPVQELAFAPGRVTTEVPIYPRETRMTWDEYLDRMKTRMRWLRETSDLPNPNQWYQRQWMERAGVDVAVKNLEDHVDSLDFLAMLKANGVTEEMFPMPVHNRKPAMESMQELDLTGWLELALPSPEK